MQGDPGLGEEGGQPDPTPVVGKEVPGPVEEVACVDVWAGEEGIAKALGPG